MHWNIEQILWAVLLASHLVLLVVLLGRDRASRFPWFTAAIILSTLRLLADHLLNSKLTTLASYWQNFTGLALDWILGIAVLVELSRHVFSSGKAGLILKSRGWTGWSLITSVLALSAVWYWGPWPTWQGLTAERPQLPLLLVVLVATKGQLLVSILTVEVALLLRIFGKRFGSGWQSHVQQIALGLSTNALAFLTQQGITEYIKRTVNLNDPEKYKWAVKVVTDADNARRAVNLLVLLWWIFWLWRDQSDDRASAAAAPEAPVLPGPPVLEADLADEDELDFRD
jgi:hypothetical protein